MKKAFKIIGTIIISLVILFSFLLAAAIGGSSHNISSESRENARMCFYITLGVGGLVIVLIWLPWKKIFK